jgi:general stress protein 26
METMVETSTSGRGIKFRFISNKATEKFDDIAFDEHVSITLADPATMNWATISGNAKVLDDPQWVHAHWTPA